MKFCYIYLLLTYFSLFHNFIQIILIMHRYNTLFYVVLNVFGDAVIFFETWHIPFYTRVSHLHLSLYANTFNSLSFPIITTEDDVFH